MATTTPKYGLNYPQLADTVASLAATVQNLAQRADLLLGESGAFNIASLAANTQFNQVVSLARAYPGNVANTPPGTVILEFPDTIAPAAQPVWFLDTWAGTASTVTGFTLHLQFATIQTNRRVWWRFLPVL